MGSHIKYIDGLKAISSIWVTLFHYVLAFFPIGYVGWECGIADSDKSEYYFNHFPLSVFTNSSFPLYTFFALIGFIVATVYFKGDSPKLLVKQSVKRYFRLMPPVLACTMICYVFLACGLFFNGELGRIAPSHWSSVYYQGGYSFLSALKSSFYTAFIHGDGYYCSILWCMNIIFIGSYLTYSFLALFGNSKFRFFAYAAGFFLSMAIDGNYASFIAGIAAADAASCCSKLKACNALSLALIFAGVLIGNFIPVVSLPVWLHLGVVYAVGNFLMILGFALNPCMQRLVSSDTLCKLGKWSFSLILIHFPIMMSFSAWIFVKMREAGFGLGIGATVSWMLSLPILAVATMLFYRFVEIPSEKFADLIWRKFQ